MDSSPTDSDRFSVQSPELTASDRTETAVSNTVSRNKGKKRGNDGTPGSAAKRAKPVQTLISAKTEIVRLWQLCFITYSDIVRGTA